MYTYTIRVYCPEVISFYDTAVQTKRFHDIVLLFLLLLL